jgi:pseudaminic acid cytidylyltransferase
MNKICIIPARGGSKRIPRKNIKEFLGKPIIAYSIEAAINSKLFDEVMVSTEDAEIAEVAVKYGAKVPFLRSKVNSDDFSGTGDVVHEVLKQYESLGYDYEVACCIYAASPFVSEINLQKGFNLLINGDFDSTFVSVRYGSPIWRSFKIDSQGKAEMNFPDYETFRSQDLINTFFDAGQFYWMYTSNFDKLENKNSFGFNKGAVKLEEFEVQDIDEPSDWLQAEFKYNYLKKNDESQNTL